MELMCDILVEKEEIWGKEWNKKRTNKPKNHNWTDFKIKVYFGVDDDGFARSIENRMKAEFDRRQMMLYDVHSTWQTDWFSICFSVSVFDEELSKNNPTLIGSHIIWQSYKNCEEEVVQSRCIYTFSNVRWRDEG